MAENKYNGTLFIFISFIRLIVTPFSVESP